MAELWICTSCCKDNRVYLNICEHCHVPKSTAGPGGSDAPKHAAVPPTVTAGCSSLDTEYWTCKICDKYLVSKSSPCPKCSQAHPFAKTPIEQFEQRLNDLETVHRIRVADIFQRAVKDAKIEALRWALVRGIDEPAWSGINKEIKRLEGGG